MLLYNNRFFGIQVVNIFGDGELFRQMAPLLKQERIRVERVYDDTKSSQAFDLNQYKLQDNPGVLYCIGYKDMKKRYERFLALQKNGVKLISYVAPNSVISPEEVVIGNGTLLNQGTLIDNYVKIGNCVFINLGASVSHHTEVGDNVFVAPRASIAGYARIHEGAFIGINATIIDHITVGEYSLVAAGAVVIEDVPPFSMVAGNPAVVKKRF